MGFDSDEYACYKNSNRNLECTLDDDRSTLERTTTECLKGARFTDGVFSLAEPVIDLEPHTSAALKAAGCTINAYPEWRKSEKVLFIEDEKRH
jgi:hypothetical protein